jgi:uncharacterized membrane protein
MQNLNPESSDRNQQRKTSWILILFFAGFVIVLVGVLVLVIAAIFYGDSSASFGTVIFIGPIPIVIGAGQQAPWMILFAIILTVIGILMFLITRKVTKRASD